MCIFIFSSFSDAEKYLRIYLYLNLLSPVGYKRLQRDMVINVYLSSLIICDIQAELNFCDIEMGDVEKIKGCKGSCQVKFFMIIVLALTQQ